MAKQKAKAEKKAEKKAEEKAEKKEGHRHKVKPPHFIDQPFFETPIGKLKRSPTFVPGRSLEEQLKLDRPRRRPRSFERLRRVKG